MSTKSKTAKRTKATKAPAAKKAGAKAGGKSTTLDAGGGIQVDVIEAKPTKATKTKAGESKPKKVSGLDAAYQVLKAKGEPMGCKEIVEEMLAKGLWQTGGKTPAATIYSAMLREIDNKPGEARFAKTGRGLFDVAN